LIFLPALLSACLPDSEMGSTWQGSREVIEGTEIVRNPEIPLRGIRAEAPSLWRAPSADDIRRFGDWAGPVRLVAAGDRVYVLDQMAHRVYGLRATDGVMENVFGRRGRGPGEFEFPYGIALRADTILVGNGGAGSLERFRPDGTYAGSIPLGARGFALIAPSAGDVYVNALIGAEGGWWR